VAEPPAVNASPLVYLAQIDALDLLRVIASDFIVTASVLREIDAYGEQDPVSRAVRATRWLHVVDAPPVPDSVRAWDLGAGEASVLSWALAHPGTEVLLDDLKARRCARSFGIPLWGTLGVVILARQRGVISAARPVMERLRAAGMYLSNRTLDQALAPLGE
jgi:predicted nucleic acid-binding protein